MENYNTEENNLVAFGGEIKALGDGKIGGYLIRFSDENTPDLVGDFFNAKTQITIPDTLPLLYNHGMDKTIKKRVIGKVTTKVDDVGVWADSQMDLRDEYEKAIYAMAESGKLGYSSGALSHLVDREPAGKSFHIKTWFVGEASLTPTPAEARNTVRTIKSLQTPDTALTDKDDNKNNQSEKTEKNIMDELEIKNLVAQGVNEALKAQAEAAKVAADKEAEIKAANESGYKQAVEDLQNRKAPAFNTKTALGFSEEKDAIPAFKHWLASGEPNGGLIKPDSSYSNIKAAFNIAAGASGGYLVPDPLYAQIIAKRDIQSWVRSAPTQKFTTPADHILVPTEGTSHTDFVLTAEGAAYDENEGTIGQTDIVLSKYTKLVKASEEFLSYQGTNFDAWLMEALGRAEASTENTVATAALYASAQASGITTAGAAAITIPELASLVGSLNGGYNVNGQVGFIMRNATEWYLKGVMGTNYYSFDGLFGKPVFQSDDMEALAATKKAVAFGNFNFFGVAEKSGMMVQRNPYLFMGTGQVGIYASIFRGYSVLQAEAFKTLLQHA